MNVLGIIPARGGSKRIPKKNRRILGGKPLICWALEAALGSSNLDRVVVSSDDNNILELVREYGNDIALERPAEISGDKSSAVEYVKHALNTFESREGIDYDLIVIVQPTSPFTESLDIDAAVEMLESTGADTVVSVVELDHFMHPLKMKTMNENAVLLPYIEEEAGRIAAHELDKVFVRNGSVYVTRSSILTQGRIIGDDCRGYLMSQNRSLDINEPKDLMFAEYLMQSGDMKPLTKSYK